MSTYTKSFVAMHWMHGLLISFVLVVAKINMEHLPEVGGDLSQYKGHIILGLLATILTLVRIYLAIKQPEQPTLNMSQARQKIATLIHRLIYVALLATGITGVATAKSANLGDVVLFGADSLVYTGASSITRALAEAHEASTTALIILIALHIFGVIAYQVQGKGNILKRMWL